LVYFEETEKGAQTRKIELLGGLVFSV